VGSNGRHSPALVQVGVSHRSAALDVRERLHVPPNELAAVAVRLAEEGFEAAVLSTCNRTELYLAGHDGALAAALARGALARRSGLDEADLESLLEERRDAEAAHHLLRVAAGLESLLPGEAQIIGQVREAYEVASAAGATGPVLSRLFEHALHCGKQVRTDTGVGTLPAAIPAAAAALAERILVIGAGKMGELAATSFLARGAERVFVANHRLERAERLAARFGGVAVPFERIGEELARADVVLSSTRCPETILHAEEVAAVLPGRGRPLLLVDIAVPRDLDPAIADLDGATLYDLDALGPEAGDALAYRDEQWEAAERIAAAGAGELAAWLRSLEVVPVVTALRRRAEEIRTAELARTEPRLRTLTDEERSEVERLTTQIVNKLLHEPTVRVKEAASEGTEAYAEALRELFALDEERA
jgi:glutamyl-tRNA reductase